MYSQSFLKDGGDQSCTQSNQGVNLGNDGWSQGALYFQCFVSVQSLWNFYAVKSASSITIGTIRGR